MKTPIAFNNGICRIYTVENRSLVEELGAFNFREETVGIKAFTEFNAIGVEIAKVISIPYNKEVDIGRVVRLNDDTMYYLISLVQVKDTFPKSLRLTMTETPLRWNND